MSDQSFYQSLGKTVRSLRKARGLTLPDVAARAGITKSCLSKWENHGSNVTLNTLFSVSAVLGVTASELVRQASEGSKKS